MELCLLSRGGREFAVNFYICSSLQGNIDALTEPQDALGEKVEVADLFTGENVKTFAREDMEALANGENREKSSIVVLYAPWCSFSQVCKFISDFGSYE